MDAHGCRVEPLVQLWHPFAQCQFWPGSTSSVALYVHGQDYAKQVHSPSVFKYVQGATPGGPDGRACLVPFPWCAPPKFLLEEWNLAWPSIERLAAGGQLNPGVYCNKVGNSGTGEHLLSGGGREEVVLGVGQADHHGLYAVL